MLRLLLARDGSVQGGDVPPARVAPTAAGSNTPPYLNKKLYTAMGGDLNPGMALKTIQRL